MSRPEKSRQLFKRITMKTRRLIRYSEAFKQQVLNEIEQGDLTISEAKRKYGIAGGGTIHHWARKYGSFGVIQKVIKVETPNERDRLKELEAENKKLKLMIAELVLDRKIAESTLEVMCEQRGWDIEEVKKKAGMLLQERQSKKGKR